MVDEVVVEAPVVAQVIEPAEVKPAYTIETCTDCGKRKKLHKDNCCIDCWVLLEEKKTAIRRKCAKDRKG